MEKELFYVIKCPPGNAVGSDSWETYISGGLEHTHFPEEEIDQGFDEDGNPRPLDYFYNDDY